MTRQEQLTDWLDRNNASSLWSHTVGRVNTTAYTINGHVVLVQRHIEKDEADSGFDIFTAHPGVHIDDTFTDAEERIGLDDPDPTGEREAEHDVGSW